MPVRLDEEVPHFVDVAIASVLSQTLERLELLIVDDGSGAIARDYLERVADADQRVRVIQGPPRGIAAALNAGAAEARGPLLGRMDADDVSEPGRWAAQVAALRRDDDLLLIGGQVRGVGSNGGDTWDISYPTDPEAIEAMLPHGNPFCHPAVTMRRDAFEAVGGYDERWRHVEDYELWSRMLSRGKGSNLSEVVLTYRVHLGQSAFRHWREQTTGMLAVQAGLRKGMDPGDFLMGDELDQSALARLGLSQRDLDVSAVESLVSQARLARRIGARGEAATLWERAHREARASKVRGPAKSRLWSTAAEWQVNDGHPLRAAAATVRSLPGSKKRLFRRLGYLVRARASHRLRLRASGASRSRATW